MQSHQAFFYNLFKKMLLNALRIDLEMLDAREEKKEKKKLFFSFFFFSRGIDAMPYALRSCSYFFFFFFIELDAMQTKQRMRDKSGMHPGIPSSLRDWVADPDASGCD